MTGRRVVVTGIGTINPLGNSIEEYFSNLEKGVSGAAPITHFDAEKFKTKFACEVKNYDPTQYFDRKEVRKYDLFTQYTLNLFPKNEKAPARISFYNSVSNPVNDVYIGRYITSENPSLFHLYGREGFCFSSSEGDVVLYDNANYGSMIQFLNVDVIGYFYSPSDSRFKKNIQPLNNTLSGLLRLSGISYQLNKETPAGTNNIKINKKENARTHFGFLAQEVKEVYPELVRTDSAGYMYVDYIGMIPLIVNSLNEIQAKVDSQETVITELQKDLAALRDGTPIGGALRKSERRNTAVESESAIVPALYQNNPNPFSATTVIRFALPYETQQADLYIYNLQGEQIRRMEIADRGEGKVTLQGSELSAGMYIYSLVADGKEIDSKRMILTK